MEPSRVNCEFGARKVLLNIIHALKIPLPQNILTVRVKNTVVSLTPISKVFLSVKGKKFRNT